MRRFLWLLCSMALLSAKSYAENSVVLGKGIKVTGTVEFPCSEGEPCWSSGFIWLIEVRSTIAGAPVKGKVRVLAASHAQPKDSYVRTVELFVLSSGPATDQKSTQAVNFGLVGSSPLYKGGIYCVRSDPVELGIPVAPEAVKMNGDGMYCFRRSALMKGGERDGV